MSVLILDGSFWDNNTTETGNVVVPKISVKLEYKHVYKLKNKITYNDIMKVFNKLDESQNCVETSSISLYNEVNDETGDKWLYINAKINNNNWAKYCIINEAYPEIENKWVKEGEEEGTFIDTNAPVIALVEEDIEELTSAFGLKLEDFTQFFEKSVDDSYIALYDYNSSGNYFKSVVQINSTIKTYEDLLVPAQCDDFGDLDNLDEPLTLTDNIDRTIRLKPYTLS